MSSRNFAGRSKPFLSDIGNPIVYFKLLELREKWKKAFIAILSKNSLSGQRVSLPSDPIAIFGGARGCGSWGNPFPHTAFWGLFSLER